MSLKIYASQDWVDERLSNMLLEGDAITLNDAEFALPSTAIWASVTYGNGRFVAVSGEADKAVYSEDGVNWTEIILPSSSTYGWNSVVYGNGKFMAVRKGTTQSAAYSEDGVNWIATSLPISTNWTSVTYGDGKFIAISGCTYSAYSEDCINWTRVISNAIPSDNYDVTYGNGKFVAIGRDNSSNSNLAAYSEDGINWTQTTMPCSAIWHSVAYGNGKFVAVTNDINGTNSAIAAYSEDGINWTQTTMPLDADVRDITYGNGKFVAVSYTSVAYSEDGINWTNTTMSSDKHFYAVTYGDNKFIIIGSNSIVYSDDGVAWNDRHFYLSQNIENITDKVRDLILPISSTAQVGQTIAVKSVDENGKPTEWEAVDMPSGNVYIDESLTVEGDAADAKAVGDALAECAKIKKWELINSVTLTEDSSGYTFTADANGEAFALKNAVVFMRVRGNTSDSTGWINLAVNGEGTYRFSSIPSGFAATEGVDNYHTVKIAIDVNDVEVSVVAYKSQNNSSVKNSLSTFCGAGSSLINGECPLTSITSVQLLCNGAALGANTEIFVYGLRA